MHTQWSPAKDRSISYAPTFWEIFGGKHQVHTSSWKYNSQGLYFKVCPNPLWWEGSKTWFSKPHVWLPNLINILPSFYFQEHWNCTKCEPWFMKMEHTPHKETLSKCIRPAYHEILEHLWTGLLPQSTTYTYDVSMHLKFLCNQSRNNKLTLPPSHSISQKEKQKEAYFLNWHSLFQYNNKSSRESEWKERVSYLSAAFMKDVHPSTRVLAATTASEVSELESLASFSSSVPPTRGYALKIALTRSEMKRYIKVTF